MGKAEYTEYLKANGATEEDIKTLTEGPSAAASIRSFDAMNSRLAAEATARAAAEKAKSDYDKWFADELTPAWAKLENEKTAAAADRARAVETLRELNRRGLVENALLEGYSPASSTAPSGAPSPNGTPAGAGGGNPQSASGFDPARYMTKDEILQVARQEGRAIAKMASIAAEHAQLFPNSDLVDWNALYERATASKKSVEQQWMDEFKVPEVRVARIDATKKAHDDGIRAEERKKVETEYASRYGNPDMRPGVPSRSPFVMRPNRIAEGAAGSQPWTKSEGELSAQRVDNAVKRQLERTA